MIKRLFSASGQFRTSREGAIRRWGLAGLSRAYDDWRFGRDIATIMAAFDRLSDRQLELIGVSRDDLYGVVEEMILAAERERMLGVEVLALLEAPATLAAGNPDDLSLKPEPKTGTEDLQAA